jgi:O-antigen/teichoic acid export membrane protein
VSYQDSFRHQAKWSLARHAVNAGALAIALPFYLHRLGAIEYGSWAIAVSLASYVQVADFGFGIALTHHIGQAHVGGDSDAVLRRFVAGLVPAALAGLLLCLLVALFAVPPLIALARVGPANTTQAIWATRVALVGGLLRLLATLPQGALSGMGELALAARLEIIATILGTALMMLVAALGFGLPGLVYAGLLAPGTVLTGALAAALRRMPRPSLRSLSGLGAEVRRLLRSGAEVQITSLAALALHPVSRLLVSRFGGASELVALDFSERAILAVRGAVVAALAPAIPAAARSGPSLAEVARERLRRLNRALAPLASVVALTLVLLWPILLGFWVGHASSMDFPFAVFTFRIYAVTYLLNLFTIFPFYTMQGGGYTRGPMVCQLLAALAAVTGGWFLGGSYGGRGVVVGLAIGVVLASSLVFFVYQSWIRRALARAAPGELSSV